MSVTKKYFEKEIRLQMLALQHQTPSDFYLSVWQRNRSPVPLLFGRALLFLISLAVTVSSKTFYIINGTYSYWFIYLTHWGLALIVLTTGISTLISARCYIYGPISILNTAHPLCSELRPVHILAQFRLPLLDVLVEALVEDTNSSHIHGAEFQLPWYVKTYWVLCNVTVPVSFLITVFYWTILYEEGIEEELNHGLDVAVHGVNSLLMLLLLLSAAHPMRLLHLHQPLVFGLVNILFGVIYYAAGGMDQKGNPYIYPVLNWSRPGPAAGVLAVTAVLLASLHLAAVGLAAARDACAAKCTRATTAAAQRQEELPLRQTTATMA